MPLTHPNADIQDFVNIHDYEHIATTLSQVPQAFRVSLLDQYHRFYKQSRDDANRYFLDIQTYAQEQGFLNHSDENLAKKAQRYSLSCARLSGVTGDYAAACRFTHSLKIPIPHKNWHKLKQATQATQQRLAKADTPEAIAQLTQYQQQIEQQWQSINARLSDEQWWIRQLIKLHDRQFEQAAIRFACVRKHRQVYISDRSLDKVVSRQQRSLEIMEGLMAVSDQGDEVEMLDILNGSPANPAIRRAELMNRLHGFEQYADHHQHIAEFYTLTAPSKYHPNSSKYNHFTPRQTQQHYFSPLWAKIRAQFKDKGLSVYGFRIAEPHADACPHWHILLFVAPDNQRKVRHILKAYALREDGEEAGAATNRFDYECIDKQKGSAIGYIAKYIAKNIDGFGMDQDKTDDGTDLAINAAAQRVRAWASIWGIRQFQQIGGSSISVWRELRRLNDQPQDNATIEAARKAADSGDWKAYLEAQGGTHIPMREQAIQLFHQVQCDKHSGKFQTNQYDEVVYRIEGVQTYIDNNGQDNDTEIQVITRLKQWSIQEKSLPELAETALLLASTPIETSEAALSRLLTPNPDLDRHRASEEFSTLAAFDLPWSSSSVNNCRNPDQSPPKSEKSLSKSAKNMPNKQAKLIQKPRINPKSLTPLAKKTS